MIKSIFRKFASSQRQVHLGLSIDSSNVGSENSSLLSDFEEGMPLWVKATPTSTSRLFFQDSEDDEDDDGPHTARIPLGYQVHLPTRTCTTLDHNTSLEDPPSVLTQRTLDHTLSFPSLNDTSKEITPLQPRLLETLQESSRGHSSFRHTKMVIPKRFMILFLAVMSVSMVVDSVRQELYGDILSAGVYKDITSAAKGTGRKDQLDNFPSYSFPQYQLQQHLPRQPFEEKNSPQRTNYALARAAMQRPVFGGNSMGLDPPQPEPKFVSKSWFSLLGGCAGIAMLLEMLLTLYQRGRSSRRYSKSRVQRRR